MNLRDLLEKTVDTDSLREMIGYTAQRLMELEVGSLTGAPHGSRAPNRLTTATATANASGKPAPALSSCVSRSSARAATLRLPRPRRMPRRHSPR